MPAAARIRTGTLPRRRGDPIDGAVIPGLSEAELRRGADEVLSERAGPGLWVFAYGALLWDGTVAQDEERPGEVGGLSARYCLRDEQGRGTPERPSLTLGLQPDTGPCLGAALHMPERDLAETFWQVWKQEMSPGFYEARWVQVRTDGGMLDAVTFLADPAHPLFAGAMPEDEVARILATTAGPGGTAIDYLDRTAEAMLRLGMRDAYLERLRDKVAQLGA